MAENQLENIVEQLVGAMGGAGGSAGETKAMKQCQIDLLTKGAFGNYLNRNNFFFNFCPREQFLNILMCLVTAKILYSNNKNAFNKLV